jgi:folate-binding Fe-S cluster repair protein YgfZ
MDCFFTIPSAIILEVSGLDAPRYLNARLTNDIKKLLKPDRALVAAALTPQGRTQGLFLVSGDVGSKVLLACDGGLKEEVVEAFKKYIVADRVQVVDKSQELSLIHVIGPKAINAALAEIGVRQKLQEFQVLVAGDTRILGACVAVTSALMSYYPMRI